MKDIWYDRRAYSLYTYHMSMGVEYSVDPKRTSGGRYQRVTTSFEYVFVGTDFARANPKSANCSLQPKEGTKE